MPYTSQRGLCELTGAKNVKNVDKQHMLYSNTVTICDNITLSKF